MNRFLLIVLAIFCFPFSLSVALTSGPEENLITAMIQVESGGDDWAIGDTHLENKAYGPLQIRKPCVDDVNKAFDTNYEACDCLGNRALSVWICRRYMEIYATETRLGRKPESEDLARIWNGGPNGWKRKSTEKYWQKVKKELEKLED